MATKKRKTTKRKTKAVARPRRRTTTRTVSRRRKRSSIGKLASEQKHTLTALASTGVAGWLKQKNIQIPHITRLGTPATYGLAAWIASRYLLKGKNALVASHVATGLLSVGAYEMAQALAAGENPFSIAGWDNPADVLDMSNPGDSAYIGAIEYGDGTNSDDELENSIPYAYDGEEI